ncbi:hypothetical protein SAMN02745176_02651 [Lutispora thermophila DSM 19022]|uniref:Uncharacterized protein n=2 Tax=Lutispora TaxID=667112 RepID=A0A1M6H4W4_9FIRM|nr:hypothetical protein SAMN02745176_02651 [Lutispora thermophila DSM 19022]
MLKIILFMPLAGVLVLLVCNNAIKLLDYFLLKRNYKLSEKFSYFLVGLMALLISAFIGKGIIYKLM